jgi:hypothetical protein
MGNWYCNSFAIARGKNRVFFRNEQGSGCPAKPGPTVNTLRVSIVLGVIAA